MRKIIIQLLLIGLFIFSIRTTAFAAYDNVYPNGNIHYFLYLYELSQDDLNWYSVGFERVSETTLINSILNISIPSRIFPRKVS